MIGGLIFRMNFQHLILEQRNHVAIITLNDPSSRNSLSTQMTNDLLEALLYVNAKEDIKAIVLTANGNSFCAGGNLAEFQQFLAMSVPELYEDGLQSTKLFQIREVMVKPIIGAINGPALGGGAGLASLCHIALGCEHTQIGLTELKLGLVPYVILPIVRRAVGERNMMELMLSARILGAEEAKEVGFLHKVVSAADLLDEAIKLAQTIAAYSPLAVKMGLRAFEETAEMAVPEAMRVLSTMRLISFKSEDLKEGATAFLEKRKPNWQGK